MTVRASCSLVLLVIVACGSGASPARDPESGPARPDAPVVAAQPGAWFDAEGGLMVVGAGRRLRVVLSAPITACGPGFDGSANAQQAAERASLTFRVLSEACRHDRPSILLPEEALTASPAELERSYHEVARCASQDLSATTGWLPSVVAASDPCPVALGLGWRLPQQAELLGLGVDDRKAVAGALFDTEDRAGFGSLLLFARDQRGSLVLVTLSPNSAEQAPQLSPELLDEPLFGAALRCVRDGIGQTSPPPLPNASACVRALRTQQSSLRTVKPTVSMPELLKLKAWVELTQRTPTVLQNQVSLKELHELLAAPALERLAQEAREERALTEHYAELADGLDDPSVSEGERQRRRAEFDSLRKRLSGKIVDSAVAGSAERTELSALLNHVLQLLQGRAAQAKLAKKPAKTRPPDYGPLITRLQQLRGEKVPAP
ncbi:MAG TPA: hypothetical protein VJN18_06920 [Polyangiaceae bacterium]|nr:hypothetical protein [Polyangiaceae bacterium]